MHLCRLIAPEWAIQQKVVERRVLEGLFPLEKIHEYNRQGYNVYYLPNHPSDYDPTVTINGTHIDKFEYVFVDMDLKDQVYGSKHAFLGALTLGKIVPTRIVDSGNGMHAYWKVSNLDALSYLRFQRRLCRMFNTDDAVSKLMQLMRMPGTINTKKQESLAECKLVAETNSVYTAEQLDKLLPQITKQDEDYCIQHYNTTFSIVNHEDVSFEIPTKFGELLASNHEAKNLWAANVEDRSKSDYRLGHLMFANNFTREEAISVLVNTAKASERAPIHRKNYAENIVNKIWIYEVSDKSELNLSSSVKDILSKGSDVVKGTSFRCHPRIDNTIHGFRLGQVIGLVAGSGVGKTTFALNMFQWFVEQNPDYHHFFIPLEQPANEIADRWKTLCGENTRLHEKVHILSNYDDDGNFRHLSFDDIKQYLTKFQNIAKIKVGCVVIDHIGALKKKGANGENQDLMDICHSMKAFAIQTNTLLIMQSQTSREKAGIGDLELNKDAAYGTVYFESYTDYLITMWQPLKRCHKEPSCPTVTAFKFCKIRHKKAKQDVIQEDTPYFLAFDSDTERLRDMTHDETLSFNYFLPKATNMRKSDRKTDLVVYQSVPYEKKD